MSVYTFYCPAQPSCLGSLAKTTLYGQKKEANDHAFNSEVGLISVRSQSPANELLATSLGNELGMVSSCERPAFSTCPYFIRAQFCRRDSIYYQPSSVRHQDAFIIMCTIAALPRAPEVVSTIPQRTVPKALIDSVGLLLDDSTYSDVEFVIANRNNNRASKPKKIYASKRILRQADYFRSSQSSWASSTIHCKRLTHFSVFQSGFAESGPYDCSFSVASRSSDSLAMESHVASGRSILSPNRLVYEDSDEEDEGFMTDSDAEDEPEQPEEDSNSTDDPAVLVDNHQSEGTITSNVRDSMIESSNTDDVSERNVRLKLSHDSSPRSREAELPDGERSMDSSAAEPMLKRKLRDSKMPSGPSKVRVVVNDVAYTTYRAVLFYVRDIQSTFRRRDH